MKAVLVPAEGHASAEFSLRLAALVAARFGSFVETFALQRPMLAGPAWDPASVAILNQADWDHRRVVVEARTLAQRIMGESGLEEAPNAVPKGLASWGWNDEPMAGDGFLGALARAFDLSVVGQPRSSGPSITTLEAALFDSGGPVLIAPPRPVSVIGETIVIAWNGSSETARTIAFAKPFLKRAERVIVLADDGSIGHRPDGRAVRQRLELSGIEAELESLHGGTIRSGEAILKKCRELGCDLLVKGAYTQSRIRQMIFGGATNHILAHADMPVFMSH